MNWNHPDSVLTTWLWNLTKWIFGQATLLQESCAQGMETGWSTGKDRVFWDPWMKGENTRWNIPMYICLHMYIIYIYIYRYVQRYTYFVCIHILDQHKSNSNTKGLRREIAFELLAVRNHMISQFPQGVVFLPCMIFLVQRCDVPILKLSLLISVSFWLPQFFFQDSISRRGSLNTKTSSSWVQIKMNYAHEHRSCWIIMLWTNLSPKLWYSHPPK